MISNPVLIISYSAMTRKAIKDIIEAPGIKYRAILQDETHKGAVEVHLKNPRAVILDGQRFRLDRDPIAFIKMLGKNRPEIPVIFFDEFAHINLDAKRAGAVKTMARPRLNDEAWMARWSEELMAALEKAVG